MTNFERITESPEALAATLGQLKGPDRYPWDDWFFRAYCDKCEGENCEEQICGAPLLRNDPCARAAWWLGLESGGGQNA